MLTDHDKEVIKEANRTFFELLQPILATHDIAFKTISERLDSIDTKMTDKERLR